MTEALAASLIGSALGPVGWDLPAGHELKANRVVWIPRDLARTAGVALKTSEWVVRRWRLEELQAQVPPTQQEQQTGRRTLRPPSRDYGAGGDAFRIAYERVTGKKNPRFACVNFSRKATNQSYLVLQHWLIDTKVPFLFLANKNGGALFGGLLNGSVKA